MLKIVEAIPEQDGRLRLPEDVPLSHARRVPVTFLEGESEGALAPALLSEPELAKDWMRREEDEAR